MQIISVDVLYHKKYNNNIHMENTWNGFLITDLLNELSYLLKKKSYCFGFPLKTGSMFKKDSHSIKRFSHLEQRYRYAMCTRKVRTILQKAFVCRGSPLVKHNKTDALTIRTVALNVKTF